MISGKDLERVRLILDTHSGSANDADFRRRILDTLGDALAPPRLVFTLDMPGFVILGREGKAQSLPSPKLSGLDYAWRVFLLGAGAGSALDASALLGASTKRPGNALRNRLADAADWVERTGGCRQLATAIRSIRVSEDGGIEYDPSRHPPILLSLL